MDSTPLLVGSNELSAGRALLQDHPVFLRASHSPWCFIPQNVLVFFRGLILAYLIAASILVLNYETTDAAPGETNARLLFDFAIISGFMVLLYFIITFSWTFTHLYYPDPEEIDGGIESWVVNVMSLPRNLASLRKQFYFTLFYITTVVFSFMNTVIYWFITRPHDLENNDNGGTGDDDNVSDIFGEGWLKAFAIVNLFGITSIIMVFEILFLNSIRRPSTISAYLFALMVFAGLYLGWAYIGHAATGIYPFFWLDPAEAGSQEAVTAYAIGFVLLAPIMYIFMQGFVGIRESLVRPHVIIQEGLGA
ncbi:ribosomal protein S2 [Trichoderma guizhouense]|uniref:Ribosomal protein S2 n=1 Tax=Trichoderma guizhouense TaxID=1491466 RepID=A0A1T3CNE6_9HYPO|nr:ribosomal protein S2 [Trichoderma guizhouense]